MVSDLDIWRAANLLIQKHGADAELEAAKRADLMLERSDYEGQVVEADQAGDRGAPGFPDGQAPLISNRVVRFVAGVWDHLLDVIIETGFGILDWLAPPPETEVDRAIREEGERLRQAFPWLDERRRRG
jgi:hypothetical protein